MNKSPFKTTAFIALLATCSAFTTHLHAADTSWDGGAGNENWNSALNWSTDTTPGTNDNVIINVGTSMNGSRRLNFNASSTTIQSLTVGLNGLVLRGVNSSADRLLTIGATDSSADSFITMNGNAHGSEHSFTSNSTTNRLVVQFGHEITLTGNGTGEYRFASAVLSNTATSTGTDTIYFAGNGNWGFVTNGTSQAAALQKSSANATLNVELKSGSGGFNGVLRYATTNAMNVDNLSVNSGTFYLENSTLTTSGTGLSTGLVVGQGGTFLGAGTVNGSATIDGLLDVGTLDSSGRILTFNNGLTLQSNATLKLGIDSLTAYDAITLPGQILVLDGALQIALTGAYDSGDSWNLFGDFASVAGSFDSVSINAQQLTLTDNVWKGVYDNKEILFDQSTGILSVGAAIPEPSSVALVLGAAVVGLTIARRRR